MTDTSVADIERERPKFLSVSEAAKYARCSRQHIYNLVAKGKLSPHSIGTARRIHFDELKHLLRVTS